MVRSSPATAFQAAPSSVPSGHADHVAVGHFNTLEGERAAEVGVTTVEYEHTVEREVIDLAEGALERAVTAEKSYGDFTTELS